MLVRLIQYVKFDDVYGAMYVRGYVRAHEHTRVSFDGTLEVDGQVYESYTDCYGRVYILVCPD